MKAAPGLHQAGFAWAQGSAGIQYSRIDTARRPPTHPASVVHITTAAYSEVSRNFYMVFSKDARLCIHETQKLVFERQGCEYTDKEAKALLLPQWLRSISFTNIKNILPNYLNHFTTYSAHAGFPMDPLTRGLQCLTAKLNPVFSTSFHVQYYWLQQTPGNSVPWSLMQGTASEIYIWGIQLHRPFPVQTERCSSTFLSNNIPTNFHLIPH